MKRRIAAIALVAIIAGCGGATKSPTPAVSPAVKTYPIVGVVRKLEPEAGRVVIRHEEIPGFMPAMTMPFTVADRASLGDLQVGDEVSGTLRVEGETHSELVGLAVTKPAEPPAMTLDLSGGQATLRPKLPPLEPGQEVPDFAVTTQDGETLRLSDLRGEVVVLTFIYTRCPLPEYCPRMDERFAELARMVAAVPGRSDRVRLLSVSFDPEHDTPEVLAKHAKLRGAKPPLWRFAVATHDELRKVAEPLGLTYGPRKDEIVHNLTTSVIGPDGRLARRFDGTGWAPEEVFQAVRSSLPKMPPPR